MPPAKKGNADDDNDEWTDDDESDVASNKADDSEEDESLGEQSFADEETKTKFTNYSMSSSQMPRNDGLQLIDEKFEKVCNVWLLVEERTFKIEMDLDGG